MKRNVRIEEAWIQSVKWATLVILNSCMGYFDDHARNKRDVPFVRASRGLRPFIMVGVIDDFDVFND